MRILLLTSPFLFSGCTPKVHLQVLEPAVVSVPTHIEQIVFVDRSEAKSLGQGIIGVVEGIVTGEEAGQDYAGREAAGEALKHIIRESPRFDLVEAGQVNVDSSLFDEQMAWGAARKVCKAAGCQGIISLEAFDSDSLVETRLEKYTETEDGKEVHKKQWHATRETEVHTAWRLYDVENKRVVHQLRDHASQDTWEHTSQSENEAIESLPSQSDTVSSIGAHAGRHYGRLVAPSYVTVTRAVFVRGGKGLAAQKNRVKARDWGPAEDAWVDIWESSAKDKVKARAAHNIAISQEIRGELDSAVEWARQAAVLWPKGRTGSYVHTLEARREKAALLQEQMALPDPDSAPEPEVETEVAPEVETEAPKKTGPTIGPPPR